MTLLATWRGRLSPVPAQQLKFPFPAAERIAVLSESFQLPKGAKQFAPEDHESIRAFQPQGIVGPADELLTLRNVPIEFGVVALSPIADGGVSARIRNLLWERFEVPVFEWLQAKDGTVIARECEAHDGMHVETEAATFGLRHEELMLTVVRRGKAGPCSPTGLTAELVTAHCECEMETMRLRRLQSLLTRTKAAAA